MTVMIDLNTYPLFNLFFLSNRISEVICDIFTLFAPSLNNNSKINNLIDSLVGLMKTIIFITIKSLKSTTIKEQEPILTLLFAHSQITQEATNHYHYQREQEIVKINEKLSIDVTSARLTKHKYAILSLYSVKERGRKQLIGKVALNILNSNNKGWKEYTLTDCEDSKTVLTLSLELKQEQVEAQSSPQLQEYSEQVHQQGKTDEMLIEQHDSDIEVSDCQQYRVSEAILKCSDRSRTASLSKRVGIGHKEKIYYQKKANFSDEKINEQLNEIETPEHSNYDNKSQKQREKKPICSSNLSVCNKLITVCYQPILKSSDVFSLDKTGQQQTITQSQFREDSLQNEDIQQANCSVENRNIEKVNQVISFETMDKILFSQKCRTLLKMNEQLQNQLHILSKELQFQKRHSQQITISYTAVIAEIQELKQYIKELERELERRQIFIKQKKQLYSECLKQLLRLRQQNDYHKTQFSNLKESIDHRIPNFQVTFQKPFSREDKNKQIYLSPLDLAASCEQILKNNKYCTSQSKNNQEIKISLIQTPGFGNACSKIQDKNMFWSDSFCLMSDRKMSEQLSIEGLLSNESNSTRSKKQSQKGKLVDFLQNKKRVPQNKPRLLNSNFGAWRKHHQKY